MDSMNTIGITTGSASIKQAILLIEDDPVLKRLFTDFLSHDDFTLVHATSEWLTDEAALLRQIQEQKIELVLLNLKTGHDRGGALFITLRDHFKDLPIVLLISRMEQVGELMRQHDGGHACVGITDFIAKPYQPRSVVARIRSILSVQSQGIHDWLMPQWIWFDETRLEVRFKVDVDQFEAVISLTPIEFKLLKHLVEYPFRIFSREELMRMVYADQRYVDESVMDRHVANLAGKLAGVHPKGPLISQVGGIGYRFEQP